MGALVIRILAGFFIILAIIGGVLYIKDSPPSEWFDILFSTVSLLWLTYLLLRVIWPRKKETSDSANHSSGGN